MTYPEYAELHALAESARRRSGGFVDPAALHRLGGIIGRRGWDWATAVLGRHYQGPGSLYRSDLNLLIIADERDVNPPLPAEIVEAREAQQQREHERARVHLETRERDVAAWQAALAQTDVTFEVRPNPTARVRHGVAEHIGHAVPLADAYSGKRKARRHPAGRALCETERRTKELRLGEPTDAPATCQRCLEWAPQVRAAQ